MSPAFSQQPPLRIEILSSPPPFLKFGRRFNHTQQRGRDADYMTQIFDTNLKRLSEIVRANPIVSQTHRLVSDFCASISAPVCLSFDLSTCLSPHPYLTSEN